MADKFNLEITVKGDKVATKQLDKVSTSIDKQGKNAKKTSKSLGEYTQTLKKVGLAVGAVGATLLILAKRFAATGDELDKMSLRTGITTEDLSRLGFAAQISGTELNILKDALRFVAKNLDMARQGLGESVRSFEALNVEIVDANGNLRLVKDVLLEVADKISVLTNATERSAFAAQIFGARYGEKLLPLLLQGSKGIKELTDESDRLGITWSKLQSDQAAELTDEITRMQGVLGGITRDIVSEFIPAYISMIEVIKESRSEIALTASVFANLLGFAVTSAATSFNFITGPTGQIGAAAGRFVAGPGPGAVDPISQAEAFGRAAELFTRAAGGAAGRLERLLQAAGFVGPPSIPGAPGVPSRPGIGGGIPSAIETTSQFPLGILPGDTPFGGSAEEFADRINFMNDEMNALLSNVQEKSTALEQALGGSALSIAGNFSNMFANIASGATGAGDAIAGAMLGALGQIATMWGTFLVSAGLGLSFIPGGQSSAGAIPFGAALLALGGTLQGLASSAGRGGRGGGARAIGAGGGGFAGGGGGAIAGPTVIIIQSEGSQRRVSSTLGLKLIGDAVGDQQLTRQIQEIVRTGGALDQR